MTDRFGFSDDEFYGDEDGEMMAYPELRRDHMYCLHGNYVGGLGADIMCPLCESGDDEEMQEYEVEIVYRQRVRASGPNMATDKAWAELMLTHDQPLSDDLFEFRVLIPMEVSQDG